MDKEVVAFDDIQIGAQWRSTGRTLTEAELAQSCMSSGDWHPIHADASYAATTSVGKRIFQGTWGVHVALGLAAPFPSLGEQVIAALGLADWRYEAPLCVGDTVHVEVEIIGKRRTTQGERGVIERRVQLVRSDGEILQHGVVRSLVKASRTTTDALEQK